MSNLSFLITQPHNAKELIDSFFLITGLKLKFVPYEKMYTFTNINQLLPRTLILYELNTVGHFCAIFINDEGINFFDSYGRMIDKYLSNINDDYYKHTLHQDFPYLIKLFDSSNNRIIYNEYCYQNKNTATCGIWCLIRLIYSSLSNEEFHDYFKNIDDKKIIKLYMNLLSK
jgi:hypothetical protein